MWEDKSKGRRMTDVGGQVEGKVDDMLEDK